MLIKSNLLLSILSKVVKEVLDQTKSVLENAEKTILTLETAVIGVVDQIKDVKGDIANVMSMFPSMPTLPEGVLWGLIPSKFIDPTQLFATQAIDNKAANDASADPVAPPADCVSEPDSIAPTEENADTTQQDSPPPPPHHNHHHHHPNENPPPPPPQENKPRGLF